MKNLLYSLLIFGLACALFLLLTKDIGSGLLHKKPELLDPDHRDTSLHNAFYKVGFVNGYRLRKVEEMYGYELTADQIDEIAESTWERMAEQAKQKMKELE